VAYEILIEAEFGGIPTLGPNIFAWNVTSGTGSFYQAGRVRFWPRHLSTETGAVNINNYPTRSGEERSGGLKAILSLVKGSYHMTPGRNHGFP